MRENLDFHIYLDIIVDASMKREFVWTRGDIEEKNPRACEIAQGFRRRKFNITSKLLPPDSCA